MSHDAAAVRRSDVLRIITEYHDGEHANHPASHAADRILAILADGGADGSPIRCDRCGADAVATYQAHTHEHKPVPVCDRCIQQIEHEAAAVNDHEMRHFGGAYGTVQFTFTPLAERGERRVGVWIDADVTLPEREGRYLITYAESGRRRLFIGDYLPGDGWSGLAGSTRVVAWMEAPEPFNKPPTGPAGAFGRIDELAAEDERP